MPVPTMDTWFRPALWEWDVLFRVFFYENTLHDHSVHENREPGKRCIFLYVFTIPPRLTSVRLCFCTNPQERWRRDVGTFIYQRRLYNRFPYDLSNTYQLQNAQDIFLDIHFNEATSFSYKLCLNDNACYQVQIHSVYPSYYAWALIELNWSHWNDFRNSVNLARVSKRKTVTIS